MQAITDNIRSRLYALQDLQYADFVAKLTPSVSRDSIIGVRTPVLRKYAKELSATREAVAFLNLLPHRYYEENNLHAMLLQTVSKDIDAVLEYINAFLPYVDNWATCDTLPPKIFRNHPHIVRDNIDKWLKSNHTYTIRFGIVTLLQYFLDDDFFSPNDLVVLSEIHSDDYYVNMAIAWYYATALSKQYDSTLPLLQNMVLDKWVHNKTIQKACESYRISPEQKIYLRTLLRKTTRQRVNETTSGCRTMLSCSFADNETTSPRDNEWLPHHTR